MRVDLARSEGAADEQGIRTIHRFIGLIHVRSERLERPGLTLIEAVAQLRLWYRSHFGPLD